MAFTVPSPCLARRARHDFFRQRHKENMLIQQTPNINSESRASGLLCRGLPMDKRLSAMPIAEHFFHVNTTILGTDPFPFYLAGTDSGVSTRTWQDALDAIVETKTGSTKDRWRRTVQPLTRTYSQNPSAR